MFLFYMGCLKGFDTAIYHILSITKTSTMTQIMKIITFFGSWQGVILVCLIILFYNVKKGLWISFVTGLGTLICHLIKYIIQRPRPDVLHLVEEFGYSFPSAHSMASFILYELIAYYLWNKSRIISILIGSLPILIGISRIYLGVHYASDVLGGFLLGFILILFVFIIRKQHKSLLET